MAPQVLGCQRPKQVTMDVMQILECFQNSIQILFTRSKISIRRLFESFTFNKRCKSNVLDNTSS